MVVFWCLTAPHCRQYAIPCCCSPFWNWSDSISETFFYAAICISHSINHHLIISLNSWPWCSDTWLHFIFHFQLSVQGILVVYWALCSFAPSSVQMCWVLWVLSRWGLPTQLLPGDSAEKRMALDVAHTPSSRAQPVPSIELQELEMHAEQNSTVGYCMVQGHTRQYGTEMYCLDQFSKYRWFSCKVIQLRGGVCVAFLLTPTLCFLNILVSLNR